MRQSVATRFNISGGATTHFFNSKTASRSSLSTVNARWYAYFLAISSLRASSVASSSSSCCSCTNCSAARPRTSAISSLSFSLAASSISARAWASTNCTSVASLHFPMALLSSMAVSYLDASMGSFVPSVSKQSTIRTTLPGNTMTFSSCGSNSGGFSMASAASWPPLSIASWTAASYCSWASFRFSSVSFFSNSNFFASCRASSV
mmetsp:Transcript_92834/g.268083  ORF Transcript_92834/g.268083 Transcript_92834/m.268083 type:complete len:206 (-) Transcript_92834:847-1464(-)